MRKNDHRIAGKIAAVFLLTLFMTVLVLHFKVRADESLIAVRIYSNAPGGMTIPIECNDETMIAESRDSAGNGQFYRTGPDGKIGFKMSDDYYPQDLSRRDEGYFFAGWQVTGAESADEGCYENLSGDVRFTAQWIGTDIKDWTVSTYNGGCILTALAGATHREEVYIPKTINGLPVVEMMDLLKGSRKIKKLYLPEGIPLEPMISLEGCSALEQINTVDWQGEKIEIRDNRLPESIKTIEDGTFVGTGLVSLTLPEVTEVKCEQTGAFEGCRYLSTVSFCKAARIAGGTFGKITSWDHREKCSVTYPGSMSDLPWDAARYSPAVVFDCTDGYCGWCGDDYQEGRALYEGSCTHWKMDLSGNMIIESFGDEDDRDTLFRTHGEAQIIKKGQYDRSLIKTLKINHAYIISNRSFRGSTDLNRVEISPGMTKIGQEAFANCYELQSVKLPGSISELGMYSFADCKNSLYFEGTKAQWEKVNKTYLWCSSSLKIHVRCTVSFNAAGHGNAPASQTNLWSNEDKALDPGDLFADDHNFTGWYSDQACTAKWDFDDPVPGDMTLYAGWDPVTGPETIAAPTFDPAPGTYSEAVNVTISCSTQDADIYYTTNGTTPTDSSSKYTGPISVSETTTIKAIAVKSGMTNSEVATATYTISTAPTPHEHSYTSEVTTKPTCTEKGIRTYTCSCGDSYTEEIPALGHDYTSVITTQPTIFTEGVITYTCTRCDHSYTERVPKVDDGENKSDLIKDVTDDNGNTKAEVGTKTNEDGSTETTVTIGGQEVEKTATDANGNETVETSIWIGGLKSSYTYTGSAIEPSFHVYDGTKKLSSGKDYSVSFKNNKNAGATATITISFTGSYKGTEQEKLSFAITPAVLGADVEATDVTTYATGKTLKPVPTMKWASTGKSIDKKNFAFTYKDAAGNDITGIKEAGQYKVIIMSKNGSFIGETTADITVTGSKKLLLSETAVRINPNKYTYTGDPITPAVGSYTLKLNGKTLTEGIDYYVSDIRNNTNPGKATIVFTAKDGNQAGYVGEKTATFTISEGRALKEGDGFTYSYDTSLPYAKGGARPAVIVKDRDVTLKAGTDYTVSYSKNTKVTNGATAVITINGKGNYKGSIKKYFTITKQDISKLAGNIITADKVESKKGYKNPTVTITDLDGKKLKAGTDFAIVSDSYSGPDANGVVTATVSGKGNYTGATSITYRFIKGTQQLSKVKAMKSLAGKTYTGREVRLTNSDLTGILYTGSKNSPAWLIPGTDFKVIGYANNTKTGTAKVSVQGIGAYGGTRTLSFKIIAKKGDYKGSLVGGEWQ